MYRNNYNTQTGFSSALPQHSQYRYTSTTGFGQRAPLYPIGPTLTQPEFKPMQRGLSPSPYLSRQGMKPPSYEHKYLPKADIHLSSMNLTHEEREKRLIEKNQKQIEQQQKRREQIRNSYEREIKALTAKLNRNLQKKMKLRDEIENLQKNHEACNQRLIEMRPPERSNDNLEHIDRKQQEMIILKNKLMTSMRESETELHKKQEEEEKYWEAQIAEKEKYLFQIEQGLREKRLQLYIEKQKSQEKPDFLSIEEQIRNDHYQKFLESYQQLEQRLQYLSEQREKVVKEIGDGIEVKKPQLHNNNIRREEIKRDQVNLELRVKELERVALEMDAVNANLLKEYERKEAMIDKYETDIHNLRSKKDQVEADIAAMMEQARNRDSALLSKQLSGVVGKLNEKIRVEQAKGARLKSAYQKLYELLCSATSKNIHQTFNQSVIS